MSCVRDDVDEPERHTWLPTGVVERHLAGGKYREVHRQRCVFCDQLGFSYPGRNVVFTWRASDVVSLRQDDDDEED